MIKDHKFLEVQNYVHSHAGQRLAGEREMSELFAISRPRLRGILEFLEREGMVQRRQGSGTYALALSESELRRVVVLIDAALKLGDDPFISRLVERLQRELQCVGAQCLIQRSTGEVTPFRGCDGVLALGVASLSGLSAAREENVPQNLLPAVGLFAASTARPGNQLSLLELDDEDAGVKAARRLVDCGVQRVYFCGRRALPTVKERLAGVSAELSRAGVPLEFLECGLNYAAGLQLGLQFSPAAKTRCGIVAANDWLAVGLHTGLQSLNPQLRAQLKLVSFDGLPLTAQRELKIDSLAVPIDVMASDAISELQHLKRPGAVGRAIRYSLEWNVPRA